MSNILVTGGAGFIGSQIVKTLQKLNHKVSVIDWQPNHWSLPDLPEKRICADDFDSQNATSFIMSGNFDAVIHMAAFAKVGESVMSPGMYYGNNTSKTKNLLDICSAFGIDKVIFSSTSSIYGNTGSDQRLLSETDETNPINPYAKSKLMTEMMLEDYRMAYDINSISLRYFNAAGADPEGKLGYVQSPATHIVPILLQNIINGEQTHVFGDDYPTTDGTCIRDYTHVQDLANAHVKAVEYLLDKDTPTDQEHSVINLGSGEMNSILDLINIAEEVTGVKVDYETTIPRPGDPACLCADISKAERILGWKPEYNVYNIMEDAWNWETIKTNITS